MTLIGMLESFFILSLGITFVLVLFLVYHFKQRLTLLENKCDTTFEIINNVVSELGNIRGAFRLGGAPTNLPPQSTPRNDPPVHTKINVTISDDEHDVSDYDENGDDDDDDDEDDDDEDSDDENGNDDDDEEDSDDENGNDNDDEEDSDDENGNDDVAENVGHTDNCDNNIADCNIDNTNPGSNDSNTVRIINLDNQQEFDIIETVEDINAENGNRDDHIDDENSHIENMEEIKLHVEKLPISEHHLDDSSITSSVAESKNNSHIYKKMTLPVLKAYVIEKGLMSDPSKMKKQELIQLIESSDI